MNPTVMEVRAAFQLLYDAFHNSSFRKSRGFNSWGESDLLPLVRTFLLGYFGMFEPESAAKLPGSLSKFGRFDFKIGTTAIEFAVRKPKQGRSPVSASVNATEAKKLLKHDGLSILVLFDFSKAPLTEEQVSAFRQWPSLGRGNHKISAFNVLYFHLEDGKTPFCITKNIRV